MFLDEPSTGMDPVARRSMWNVIMRIVTENKECAMILTTHRCPLKPLSLSVLSSFRPCPEALFVFLEYFLAMSSCQLSNQQALRNDIFAYIALDQGDQVMKKAPLPPNVAGLESSRFLPQGVLFSRVFTVCCRTERSLCLYFLPSPHHSRNSVVSQSIDR